MNSIFEPLDIHLAVRAALEGRSRSQLYLDPSEGARAALLKVLHRYFLAGDETPEFNQFLSGLLMDEILPEARRMGHEVVTIYPSHPGWERALPAMLPGKDLLVVPREYYAVETDRALGKAQLPEGFELRAADAALLDENLLHTDELKEEMCSERESVEEFLAKSFGVCAVRGDELAGWCLSEYNTDDRCEVGIATQEPYQRRGLATAMTLALVEMARERGVRQVGWHCFARNLPSGATARRAGFRKERDYSMVVVWVDKRTE